jgi:uncharacterized membrane protein YccC
MGQITSSVTRLYRRYIHPYDPAFLVLRRSLKTLSAMAISLWILWPWPHLLTWGPVAAFVLSQVPPGLPLAARRRAMLTLVGAAALLVIPATALAGGVALPTIFVVLATLAAFAAAALGPAYGACALWALLLVVVALGKQAPAAEGLARAGAVALGGLVCWALHFWVFPLRPRQLYKAALNLALIDLEELWGLLREGYASGEVEQARLDQLKERALKALHRLRGLPQFLETPPGEVGAPAQAVLALGRDLVRAYENLLALWQLRQQAHGSPLFSEYLPRLAALLEQGQGLLSQMRQAARKGQGRAEAGSLIRELGVRVEELRRRRAAGQEHSVGEYVLVFNSLAALLALARDLGRAEGQRRAVELLHLPPDKPAPSWAGFWGRLKDELRPGSPILRAAGQAAVAAGGSMLLVKLTNLPNGYWVVLFTLLVVKPDLGTTLAMGKRRLLGASLGAAAALAFLPVLGGQGAGFYAACGLGAFATLYLMSFPHPVFTGGASSFTMILITSSLSPLGWWVGLIRVGEVGLAVVIGLATARFLWPNRASRRVRGEAAAVYEKLAAFLGQAAAGFLAGGLGPDPLSPARQELQDKLAALRASYAAAGREPGRNPAVGRHFGEVIEHAAHLFDQLLALEAAAAQGGSQGLLDRVAEQVRPLCDDLQKALDELAQSLASAKRPPRLPPLKKRHAQMLASLKQLKAAGGEPAGQSRLALSSFLWELRQVEREAAAARPEVAALAND